MLSLFIENIIDCSRLQCVTGVKRKKNKNKEKYKKSEKKIKKAAGEAYAKPV